MSDLPIIQTVNHFKFLLVLSEFEVDCLALKFALFVYITTKDNAVCLFFPG